MDMAEPFGVEGKPDPHPTDTVELALAAVFARAHETGAPCDLAGHDIRRCRPEAANGLEVLVDVFAGAQASCAFLRVRSSQAAQGSIALAGPYRIEDTPAGGWLLLPAGEDAASYWVPLAPRARRLDADGHILEERVAALRGLDSSPTQLRAAFELSPSFCLDIVVWRFEPAAGLVGELQQLLTLETQPLFMWSSHTNYSRPADLYAHLVFGHVYENHKVWPRYWKVCSELDAYALYVALSGLALATGKRLYFLLRQQVVYSVIARQAKDGGWYHGEWTDSMESHYRLVVGAVLMLADHVAAHDDAVARHALERAMGFLAARAQRLDVGLWFMHDSLEGSAEGMRTYPFGWSKSRALGKANTNMLILNTHLDTTIAFADYAAATGDGQYRSAVESARSAALAVVHLRPAERLYRTVFRILDLTLLPKREAAALPVPVRVVKRIGWKYLVPSLHRLKALFPRLVMPNGYIDRALCQKGFATRYQSVHLWDLVRYVRRFPDDAMRPILERALSYTYGGNIRAHWKESPERQDALGFWAEALYHLCILDPDPTWRRWLAEAVIDCEDVSLGLPPSVLGANGEAVAAQDRSHCPSPAARQLRIVNLSHRGRSEYLVVNPTGESLPLEWQTAPSGPVVWSDRTGRQIPIYVRVPLVAGREWVHGMLRP